MQAREAASTYKTVLGGAGGRELTCLSSARAGHSLCASLYASRPYAIEVPPMAMPRLSINLSSSPLAGRVDGEPPIATVTSRYSLFLTPAGAGARWRKQAATEHVNVYFAPEVLADVVDARAWRTPRLNVGAGGAREPIRLLERELRRADPFAGEAVDSLARLLLIAVVRSDGGDRRALSAAALRRVYEYVDARLHHRIGVLDLARVAGLAPARFTRAFTAGVGEAPYQFVLRRRMETAVRLLAMERRSTAEVAERCGFASPQHLSSVLRRRLGLTPSDVRALGARAMAEALARGAGTPATRPTRRT